MCPLQDTVSRCRSRLHVREGISAALRAVDVFRLSICLAHTNRLGWPLLSPEESCPSTRCSCAPARVHAVQMPYASASHDLGHSMYYRTLNRILRAWTLATSARAELVHNLDGS